VKPRRLQLVGLRSWKTERELKFHNIDLAAVIGPTGAGKSSILEAIVYALYNTSTFDKRGVGSLISSDAKTMSVTLDFEADGEGWRVTRSISRDNYPPSVHKITCLTHPAKHPTVDGETATNAAIERLIGLDRDQFLTAVLLPQGRFQTLLMATAGERAGILKGVFRLDELDAIRERATTSRRNQVEPALDARRAERAQLLPDPEATLVHETAEAERYSAGVDKLEDLRGRYVRLAGLASELAKAVNQARQQGDALAAAAKAIPALDGAIQAEAEIGEAQAKLQSDRAGRLAERVQAQAKLDRAAAEGVTIETLATARQVLDAAKTALPTLEQDAKTLNDAREALAQSQWTLRQDTNEHSQHVAELGRTEEEVSALKEAADLASARVADGADNLRVLRDRQGKADEARRQLAQDEELLTTATEAAETAAARVAAEKAAAEGATAVLEAVRKAHEAAHLATGLRAGESCPICQRQLPTGFEAPEAPTTLTSAQSEATRLREISEGSAADATRAAATVDTLAAQLAVQRSASELAEANVVTARKQAQAALGLIDLARGDGDLLAPLQATADRATITFEQADRGLAATRATLKATTESLRQRAQTCSVREQELDSEASRIEREQQEHATALADLPEGFRPRAETVEAIRAARNDCAATLDATRALHEGVRTATEAIEAIDDELNERARERAEKVDTPRRAATASAREIVAKVRELRPEANLPRPPVENAVITAHATWILGIADLATDLAQVLHAKADEDDIASAGANQQAEDTLRAADELVEATVASAADLDRQLNEWRANLIAAERDRERAAMQIPQAASLDSQIDRLLTRRESLEEVTRLLGDGHFIKWLVERRQQLLLVVASEIFAGMTADRYRFAANFTIVDGRTGVARNPRTLSGGESFMASLALALGMAEIAASSGGRIGSLYLDEGFGALDPNALDESITALEQRARGGQMILIISHVDAVAQRIERVLKVSPDPAGSDAEWLDDEDREALLLDAATAVA